MLVTEVLPEIQKLSRLDKIRLVQFLVQELERDEDGVIESGRSYPVWSPDQASAAAAALLQALQETGPPPHPWLPFAGMFKGDPDFEEVVEIMAENRRKMDEDPTIP